MFLKKRSSYKKYQYVCGIRSGIKESSDWELIEKYTLEKAFDSFMSYVVKYKETYYNQKGNLACSFIMDDIHKNADIKVIKEEEFSKYDINRLLKEKNKTLSFRK